MRKGLGFFIVRLGGQLEWFTDVLSSVLRELRFESASYRRLDLRAPWRLRFDGGLRGVHIVVQGRCSNTVDGEQPRNVETVILSLCQGRTPHT